MSSKQAVIELEVPVDCEKWGAGKLGLFKRKKIGEWGAVVEEGRPATFWGFLLWAFVL